MMVKTIKERENADMNKFCPTLKESKMNIAWIYVAR